MSEIIVEKIDITDLDVDAVVNAANNHLWMGSGVAGAIRRKGGIRIEQDAVEKAPIPVGSAVATDAGNLKARKVIHAAIMSKELRTDAGKIEAATRSALECAREEGARTIAFPAFGTGGGGFPAQRCAEIMTSVVRGYVRENPNAFDRIYFSVLDEAIGEIFQKAVDGHRD